MSGQLLWSRFQVNRSNGSLIKLCIRELPENSIPDAIDLFFKYFVPEETFHKAAGIAQNPQAIAEYRLLVTELMKNSSFHNIICHEDRDDGKVGRILGISSMELSTVGIKFPEQLQDIKYETDEVKKLFKLLSGVSLHNVMEELQISHFFGDIGTVVHPEFRKMGILAEFAKASRFACIVHNIAATGALVTSVASQKAGDRDNWQTVRVVDLDELGHQHGVKFEDGSVSKLLIWKNPLYNDSLRKNDKTMKI